MLTAKRLLDIVASGATLLVIAPLLVLIGAVIKLEDGGPVLYVDERVGKDGLPFRLYKFRSMVVGAEQMGLGRATATADPRITRIGRALREYSLDELPQLLNILKGDMSIVGPRPTIPAQVAMYTRHQRRRLEVTPGLTGWAQVSGRNAITWEDRIEHDIWYVQNWSLRLDLWIILRTPMVLLRREGLYGPEGITTDFRGQ